MGKGGQFVLGYNNPSSHRCCDQPCRRGSPGGVLQPHKFHFRSTQHWGWTWPANFLTDSVDERVDSGSELVLQDLFLSTRPAPAGRMVHGVLLLLLAHFIQPATKVFAEQERYVNFAGTAQAAKGLLHIVLSWQLA